MSERIRVGDIPQWVQNRLSDHLGKYVVGIVGVPKEHSPVLLGSGTLIRVDETYAILTADHVIQTVVSLGYETIHLLMYSTGFAYLISLNELRPGMLTVARNYKSTFGPDLSVIVLPTNIVSDILKDMNPQNHFYNIAEVRDAALALPHQNHQDLWAVCGFLSSWTTFEETTGEEAASQPHFRSICGIGGPKGEIRIEGEYDYFELEVEKYEEDYLPETFEGLSGGGVWLVPVKKFRNNYDVQSMISSKLLIGVAFYQGMGWEGGVHTEGCHGWLSIYIKAYQAIEEYVNK